MQICLHFCQLRFLLWIKFFSVFHKDLFQTCSDVMIVNLGPMVGSTETETLRCWKAGNHQTCFEGVVKKWAMWLYGYFLPVWPVWLPSPPPLLWCCCFCLWWLGVSLMCVGVCGTLKGGQDGNFTHVNLHLPTWKRWCRSEWTPLASPVETHLKGSAHWSVTLAWVNTHS